MSSREDMPDKLEPVYQHPPEFIKCYGMMDKQNEEGRKQCHFYMGVNGKEWGCPLAHGCFVDSYRRKEIDAYD